MTNNHRIAADLCQLFGVNAGARRSAAAIARELNQRSVVANRVGAREAAFDLMWDYEARGLVDDRPGPHGGAGWRLTANGAAIVAESCSADVPARAS